MRDMMSQTPLISKKILCNDQDLLRSDYWFHFGKDNWHMVSTIRWAHGGRYKSAEDALT